MADGKKIVIVAPADASDDVNDAVKLLKGAGYDVDIEEPTPKSLLHIVLGLMGPNAYGFGPSYSYQPGGGATDTGTDATGEDDTEADPDTDTEAEDDAGGDDFNFESLGMVSVDGELIEAVTHNSDTSILCVESLKVGAKTAYSLNESRFTFFPENIQKLASRVDVVVDKHRTSIEIPVQESKDKPKLLVGKDLRDMFPVAEAKAEMGMSDEVAAKKIFDKVKGEPNLKTSRVKQLVKQYLPMVKKNDTDVTHLTALVVSQLQDADLI